MKLKAKSSKLKVKILALSFVISLSAFSLQLSASHAESGLEGVEILFLEGRYEKVRTEAERLIDGRARHRDELYYIRGLSELKTGRFREARQSFEEIISKYRRPARAFDAHIGIGDSFFLAGDAAGALQAYKEALDKFPDDKNIFVPLYRMGNCYDKLGDSGSAKRYYDKARSASSLGFETMKRFGPSPTAGEIPKVEPGGFISVQVGSFRDKKNADRLTRKLSRTGYDSYVETSMDSGEKLYRVRAGRFKSRDEARSLESRLNQDGYRTKISGNIV